MAEIAFVPVLFNGNGKLLRAEGLATGDNTGPLKELEADTDMTLQIHGTIGGATVTWRGSVMGTEYQVIDDAFGQPMSYTALTAATKPIGPALPFYKGFVVGGAASSIIFDVYITKRSV